MLEITLGSALMYYFANHALDVKPKPKDAVYYTELADSRDPSFSRNHREMVQIKPALENQFRGSSVRHMTIVVALRRSRHCLMDMSEQI